MTLNAPQNAMHIPATTAGAVFFGLPAHVALVAVMALSAVLKLILASFGEDLNTDAILYIAAAQEIAGGRFGAALALFPMPALPALIAGLHILVGDWVWAARLVSTISLVAASVPLYAITAMLFDRRAGLWAVLLLAVSPVANGYAVDVMRDPTYVLLFLGAVWSLMKAFRTGRWPWVGLALGLSLAAILFRVEAIVLLVAPPLFLLGVALVRRQSPSGRLAARGLAVWVGCPAVLLAALLAVIGPEVLSANRFDQLLGEARSIIDLSAFRQYQEIYAHLKAIQADPPFSGYSRSLMAFVRHYMPVIYLMGLVVLLGKIFFPPFLIPLMFGIRAEWRRRAGVSAERLLPFFMFGAYFTFLFYFLLTTDRMVARLLLMPTLLLFPWIGAGMTHLVDFATADVVRYRHVWTAAIVIFFLVFPATKSVGNTLETDSGLQQAASRIAARLADAQGRLVCSDVRLSFYAGRLDDYRQAREDAVALGEDLQERRFKRIDRYARRQKAEWLVLHLELAEGADLPKLRTFDLADAWPAQGGQVLLYRKR